ncbi:MAG: hypothetical protein QOJ76_2206 [Acidobacteriota bacterium]|jgi:hypothetical protein|nr:hypothetical protein [Acidobacteriota bacterium]
MTVRKPASTFLFALCLALTLTLTGCNLLGSNEPPSKPADAKAPNAAQAEEELRAAQKKFDKKNQESQDANEKAAQAKSNADTLEARARKNGVDINDPNSQTAKARATQKDAEDAAAQATATVSAAGQELEQAKIKLEAARNPQKEPRNSTTATPTTAPTKPAEGFMEELAPWVLPSIAGIVGLVVLAALFWWIWQAAHVANARTEELLNLIIEKQSDKFHELNQAVSGLKDLSGRVVALQDSVFRLGQRIQTGQDEQRLNRRLSEERDTYNNAPTAASNFEPPADEYADDSMDFPIAVNSFLTRLGNQQLVVKPDPLKGILVKDPEKRGQFVLARDGSVPGGYFYIVPRIVRFQAQEDFYNHFEQFYDCARPVAGEVWVNEPATVDPVDGGWKLRDKGILEVKS